MSAERDEMRSGRHADTVRPYTSAAMALREPVPQVYAAMGSRHVGSVWARRCVEGLHPQTEIVDPRKTEDRYRRSDNQEIGTLST